MIFGQLFFNFGKILLFLLWLGCIKKPTIALKFAATQRIASKSAHHSDFLAVVFQFWQNFAFFIMVGMHRKANNSVKTCCYAANYLKKRAPF
jgi:hypothetical protein